MADYFINQTRNQHLPCLKDPEAAMPPPQHTRPTFASDPQHYRRESASDIHEILTSTASTNFSNSGKLFNFAFLAV